MGQLLLCERAWALSYAYSSALYEFDRTEALRVQLVTVAKLKIVPSFVVLQIHASNCLVSTLEFMTNLIQMICRTRRN
jgi:hypothetical protein